MRTVADLKAHVGPERFEAACRWAWQTADATGQYGKSTMWPDGLENVPYELEEYVWDQSTPLAKQIELLFELYRVMPCYTHLSFIHLDTLATDPGAFDLLWRRMRECLDDPADQIATPVAYWLWCGPFQDRVRGAEAWHRATEGPGAGDRTIDRALGASGPVPWEAKAPTLRRLTGDPTRSDAVFGALAAGVNDFLGKVDAGEAISLLDRLELSEVALAAVPELRAALEDRVAHPSREDGWWEWAKPWPAPGGA